MMKKMTTPHLKHHTITDAVIRCFFEVYNELGHGFLESVYENAMYLVLSENRLLVEKQKNVPVYYRGIVVGDFRADLVVDNKVIVEIKAVDQLIRAHEAQLLHYLKATDIEVGLLLNFGGKPEFKRFLLDNPRKHIHATP